MLKLSCENTYNCIAASADDDTPILSGKPAHGRVALLWKVAIDDYISPLDIIKSDRIVGIECDFPGYELLFIVGVYLPSASLNLEEYCISIIFGHYTIPCLQMLKSFTWVTLMVIKGIL